MHFTLHITLLNKPPRSGAFARAATWKSAPPRSPRILLPHRWNKTTATRLRICFQRLLQARLPQMLRSTWLLTPPHLTLSILFRPGASQLPGGISSSKTLVDYLCGCWSRVPGSGSTTSGSCRNWETRVSSANGGVGSGMWRGKYLLLCVYSRQIGYSQNRIDVRNKYRPLGCVNF